jgi:hypothetical protein
MLLSHQTQFCWVPKYALLSCQVHITKTRETPTLVYLDCKWYIAKTCPSSWLHQGLIAWALNALEIAVPLIQRIFQGKNFWTIFGQWVPEVTKIFYCPLLPVAKPSNAPVGHSVHRMMGCIISSGSWPCIHQHCIHSTFL